MSSPIKTPQWGDFENWSTAKSDVVAKQAAQQQPYRSETRSVFGSTELPITFDDIRVGFKREKSGFATGTSVLEEESPWEDHQRSLPRLPIPPLEDTLDRYATSLEAVVDPEAFFASKDIIEEFQESAIGKLLQSDLKDYADGVASHGGSPIEDVPKPAKHPPSWLEPFWDNAYLRGRDPIPINVNYFFGFESDSVPGVHPDVQCRKAASLVHAAAEICLQIRYNDIELDFERDLPLCMSQLRRVFCTSRIPFPKRDKIVCFTPSRVSPLTFDEKDSATCEYASCETAPRHIVVMVRNRMFKIQVLTEDDEKEKVVPVADICATLMQIIANAAEGLPGCPIGVFTTANRDQWAHTYSRLQELDSNNKSNLLDIASALIVVCLDGFDVKSAHDHALQLLHGNGSNRWFDRHNLIVSANGEAGINFEHSVGDGITTLKVADMMYAANAKRYWDDDDAPTIGNPIEFEELSWEVDEGLGKDLRTQFDEFRAQIEGNDTSTLKFDRFGGNLIKANKLSPDAFVQMAFQFTHYRLFGRVGATYEAASTRCFLHGRTETVRSATAAALDFCKVCAAEPVSDPKVGSKLPRPIDVLRTAVSAHTANMRLAKGAMGVDRHLFGLRMMALRRRVPLPKLFTDESFTKSSHWSMSTSHCGSSALNLFGFGPVVGDGLGLGYMIKNDSISVVVTSKFNNRVTSSSVFCNMLESTLLHLKAILEAESEQRARAKSTVRNFYHPTNMKDVEFEDDGTFVYD